MGALSGQAFAKDVCVQASNGLGVYVFKGVKSLTKLGQVSPIIGFNIVNGIRHPISGTAIVSSVDPANNKNVTVRTGFTVLQDFNDYPYTVEGVGPSLGSANAYADFIAGDPLDGAITWSPIDCKSI